MNKKHFLNIILLAIFLICGFFSPFVFIDTKNYSLVSLIFSYNNVLYWILNIIIVLLILSYLIITYIHNEGIIKFLLSLSCLILLSFYEQIASKLIDKNIDFGPGYIYFLMIFLSINLLYFSLFKKKEVFSVVDIVEMALFVSLSVILDLPFCKIKIFENGGSISLAMLPLIYLSIRKGFIKGFISSGIVYGIITCLLDGYGFITYPLDYLCGFGSLAIAGLFKKGINNNNKIKSILFFIFGFLVSVISRLIFHAISGVLIYELDFVSSIVYQLTYLVPSFLICLIVGVILLPFFQKIMQRYPD